MDYIKYFNSEIGLHLKFEKSKPLFDFLRNYIRFSKTKISSKTLNTITLNNNNIKTLIFSKKINNIRYINKFFEESNNNLNINDLFIGHFEPLETRKINISISKFNFINKIKLLLDFIFNRFFPRISFFKKIYFVNKKEINRALSKAEVLGRLIYCGFDVVSFKKINGLIYLVVKKIKNPSFDINPSYGPIYAMPRIGINYKTIKVYKIRTMHPYSEYLHDFILKNYGYSNSGKPSKDFRVTNWGKFFRKYWIDELPQIYNLLKGDMSLVGARPISFRYSEDIPKDLMEIRTKYKPGCIPPYVALNTKRGLNYVLDSEREYFKSKEKSPYLTDLIYFCKAAYNIIIKKRRSA
tara:strand:- start:6801 stop:7856 length:1056 start_codon:yes stop_codon:yes gene_type:complete